MTVALLVGLTACDTAEPEINQSQEVVTYLDAAVDTLQTHLYFRDQVDWNAFRDDVRRAVGDAQQSKETWQALRIETERIDRHSYFLTPGYVSNRAAPSGTKLGVPLDDTASKTKSGLDDLTATRLPGDRVGYIRLPGTVWLDSDEMRMYDDTAQSLLEETDSTTVCGWVLDLRQNRGGNMWPMLAGIGPMLGSEKLGSFRYPDGTEVYGGWFYRDGASYFGDEVAARLESRDPYVLKTPTPPVAVLTDPGTGSSGEAVATAFRGRPNTRSFGQPTYGVPTSPRRFTLSDGLVMGISVVAFADRAGRVYTTSLEPDVLVPSDNTPIVNDLTPEDDIVQQAHEWVRTQSACTSGDAGVTTRTEPDAAR